MRKLLYFTLIVLCLSMMITLTHASTPVSHAQPIQKIPTPNLQKLSGFFRVSYDNLSMPNHNPSMGLLGVNYYADITPLIYGGLGGYGAVNGNQGGLFVLGLGGGLHPNLTPHWIGDINLFVGGGGGRSALVGGGLMLRPSIGIEYMWQLARLGLHYSYITFPSGMVHSYQIGLDLDIPCDIYYLSANDPMLSSLQTILFSHLDFERNEFGLLLQRYHQKNGTLNVNQAIQDGTIDLIGAELDHYITTHGFWYLKMAGAYSGIPNGYMDVFGGLGYQWLITANGIALVPQLGIGAGGGGSVDTGGGMLIQPQLGIEIPLMNHFAARISEGYIWAPSGQLSAYATTGEILYHLDFATNHASATSDLLNHYHAWNWRLSALNQTYIHPQRNADSAGSVLDSKANVLAIQLDQIMTPYVFFSYQAAGAYSGDHVGGYATGMIGPGIQSKTLFNDHLRFFGECLVGAGGGGNLALSGGEVIEPLLGLYYALTPAIQLQTSLGQIKALKNDLNTPIFNLGLTLNFGTLNHI